jgi:hypothetical protein
MADSKNKNNDARAKAALHVRNLCIKFCVDARANGEEEMADAYSDIANVVDDIQRRGGR